MKTLERKTIVSEKDKLQLSVLIGVPEKEFIGIVQISHGMCEHKERYLPFLDFLTERGYITVIHDHRGHGESVVTKEDLGFFYQDGANALIEDLHQITLWIKNKYPNLPYYLFGHSMGSLIARAYLKRYDRELDGLIICGCPSNNLTSKLGQKLINEMITIKGEHFRSEQLNTMLFGSFNRKFDNVTSKNDWICSNKNVVEEYDKDPLCGFVFTLNGFLNLCILIELVYSKEGWNTTKKKLPIWFISGTKDPCLVNKKKFIEAISLLQYIGYENVTYHVYSGMRHEILNETKSEKVFEDIAHKLLEWKVLSNLY